jgi:hypothetical protein
MSIKTIIIIILLLLVLLSLYKRYFYITQKIERLSLNNNLISGELNEPNQTINTIIPSTTTLSEDFLDDNDQLFLQAWSDEFHGFPFQSLKTYNDKRLKIAVLSAPLYKEERHKYHKMKEDGYLIVGISSYGYYPFSNEEDFKHDSRSACLKEEEMQNILNGVDCWLACSKEPIKYNVPQLFFSESDCPSIDVLKPKGLAKQYDVIYNSGSDCEFHEYHKNWLLAKECIQKMSDNGLKVLVIGRNAPTDFNPPNVEYKPFLNWYEFIDKMEESKLLFVPNVSDASPRIITEAICKGTPVIVNKDIFGGWKYVNDSTGKFFTSSEDIMNSVNYVLNKQYDTRKWFLDNYFPNGESIKRKQLTKFIKEIYNTKRNNPKIKFSYLSSI